VLNYALMKKSKAIDLLGGTVASAALQARVSRSAVSQWPEDLPPRITDRVLAALARRHLDPGLIGEGEANPDPEAKQVHHIGAPSAEPLGEVAHG